jgi:hypothetical protein
VTLRGFLELPDGMAIVIGPAGLLVGRHRSCDLQLAAETASRRHALLRTVDDGVELIVLGRHPVEVDGEAVTSSKTLAHGARLNLPGLTCGIRIDRVDDSVAVAYVLRHGDQRFPIRSSPFTLPIEGAPRIWSVQGELVADLEDGTQVALHEGATLEVRGQSFVVERAPDDNASTVAEVGERRVRGVMLQAFPRGGRVTFQFGDGEHTVYLPGRRYRLIAALVTPPPPLAPGDFIPDSELVPLVWNDNDQVGGRTEINVVIARTRQDLLAAGIAPPLERAPGGRGTRLVLAPSAVIRTVE